MTLYGGKKIVVSEYEDEIEEADADDFGCDAGGVSVQIWIDPYSDDGHQIEVEGADCGQIPLHMALDVAKAINTVARWPSTKEGKAEIARLRKVQEDFDNRLAAGEPNTCQPREVK